MAEYQILVRCQLCSQIKRILQALSPTNVPRYGEEVVVQARIFRELLSRDHADGRATGQPQGVGSEAYLEWYVAGTNVRGRQEGRPYPWSQQVIHEISGLVMALWLR